jgi:hypothetical protein
MTSAELLAPNQTRIFKIKSVVGVQHVEESTVVILKIEDEKGETAQRELPLDKIPILLLSKPDLFIDFRFEEIYNREGTSYFFKHKKVLK